MRRGKSFIKEPSELCELCASAVNPVFGCGSAALGLCRERRFGIFITTELMAKGFGYGEARYDDQLSRSAISVRYPDDFTRGRGCIVG